MLSPNDGLLLAWSIVALICVLGKGIYACGIKIEIVGDEEKET